MISVDCSCCFYLILLSTFNVNNCINKVVLRKFDSHSRRRILAVHACCWLGSWRETTHEFSLAAISPSTSLSSTERSDARRRSGKIRFQTLRVLFRPGSTALEIKWCRRRFVYKDVVADDIAFRRGTVTTDYQRVIQSNS